MTQVTLQHQLAALRQRFPDWKITHSLTNGRITATKHDTKNCVWKIKHKNFYAVAQAIARHEGVLKPRPQPTDVPVAEVTEAEATANQDGTLSQEPTAPAQQEQRTTE